MTNFERCKELYGDMDDISINFIENLRKLESYGMTEIDIAKSFFGKDASVMELRYAKAVWLRKYRKKYMIKL